MCGRFSLTLSDIAALARAWGAEVDAALLAGWRPRFNVAPGQRAPLLRGPAGARRLALATFGLPAAHGALHLNARAETAAARPAFREALRQGRAVVPADGFYEWEGPPAARRPSWFHRPDGAPLLLAAVSGPGSDGQPAFAILTCGAVAPVARLHDRMPVLVPPEALEAWLAEGPPPALPPSAPGALAARLVSPRVNSPRVDGPECLEAPEQGSLF
ncbi:MAG: SOS response-associated peptidase [Anaeromyxobacter sp.]|nr:SOS response-associated peptidase [Anaeromyxobacter sp.]MBL0276137.1 SOS response-associated peptidase [Anaeromyxobacter sp.]